MKTLVLSAALLFSATVAAQALSPLERQVSGVWQLVGTEQKLKDGTTRSNPMYGTHPVGYVFYDPTRRMCLFFTRSQQGETEPAPLGNGLNAYCGRWRVDSATHTMFHITEMDVLPKRAAIVREPKFELAGNRLYLHPPFEGQDILSNTLIFERVKADTGTAAGK